MTEAKEKSLEHMNDSTLQKICTPTAEQISQHEQPIACEKLLTVTKYHVKKNIGFKYHNMRWKAKKYRKISCAHMGKWPPLDGVILYVSHFFPLIHSYIKLLWFHFY